MADLAAPNLERTAACSRFFLGMVSPNSTALFTFANVEAHYIHHYT
jgi:hypothetical protein